jgi:hypothetical protein
MRTDASIPVAAWKSTPFDFEDKTNFAYHLFPVGGEFAV